MPNELPELLAFLAAAQKYCAIIEIAETSGYREFLMALHVALPELIGAAARLPEVVPENTEDVEVGTLSRDERAGLGSRITEKLGSHDVYWEVFDPTSEKEPVAGTLSGDLSEIYLDLREVLLLREKSQPTNDVTWDARFGFMTHWGKHATSALRAIHWLVFGS